MLRCMQGEAIYKVPWLVCKARVGRPKSMRGEEFVYTKHRWCGYVYGLSRSERVLWT